MIINSCIILIFLLSIVYCFKYKFVHLKFINESKIALKNKSSKSAFLLSLGSHIGAGNIIGVTSALVLGGPGTLFWMIICTVFTSIFSLIENTLGLKYVVDIDGERRGGSPYYILFGLKRRKLAKIFSVFLVLSSTIFFLPIQVRGIFFSIKTFFNINDYLIFVLILTFCFMFVFRGTSIITKIINKIVPIMTISFLFICFYALILKINNIGNVINIILSDAFNFKSGSIGVIIVGLKRSLFSNEAGLGTAPSINSYSNNVPIRQGYLQVLTCVIDTVVMCVLLGFIILLYEIDLNDYNGEQLSIKIFETIFKNNGKLIGCFLLLTFSLATVISSYYAGETNMLFNCIKNNKSSIYKFIYQLLFIIGILLGVFVSDNKVWNLVDYGLVILGIVNIFVIIKMKKSFENELKVKTK